MEKDFCPICFKDIRKEEHAPWCPKYVVGDNFIMDFFNGLKKDKDDKDVDNN